jgi:hypothetical protein
MSNGESGGPYIGAAFLCEKVLQERDGVLSAIRMVDRIIQAAVGPSAPDLMPAVTVDLKMLLVFKSGSARGRYSVDIRPVLPSQRALQPVSLPMQLEGDDDRGVNLIVNIGFQATEEGLYWFDVLLNGDLVTRVPLRIVYQRVSTSTSGATPVH